MKDADLRSKKLEQNEHLLLKSMVYPCLVSVEKSIEDKVIKLINTIFDGVPRNIEAAIEAIIEDAKNMVKRKDASLFYMNKVDDAIHTILSELVVRTLLSGTYQRENLLEQSSFAVIVVIESALKKPFQKEEQIEDLMSLFKLLDNNDSIMRDAVAELCIKTMLKSRKEKTVCEYPKLVSSYFYGVSSETVEKILAKIKEREGGVL